MKRSIIGRVVVTVGLVGLTGASGVGAGCGGSSQVVPEAPAPLGPNDVSVLFPDLGAALWPASLAGRGGPLVPEDEFRRIDNSLVREVDDEAEYAALRVVAARFDPCFRHAFDGPCEPQIRLVLQVPDAAAASGFVDGAVHALYRLDDAAMGETLAELRRLRALAPENARASLGVSPALAAQGLDGAYGKGLKELVTRFAGAGSLVRLTFMTRTFARSGQWQFGGLERGQKLTITGIDATQQNITRNLGGHDYAYVVAPRISEPTGAEGLDARRVDGLAPERQQAVFDWARRHIDPDAHLPDTTDCASCHVAGHVADRLERLRPELAVPGPERELTAADDDFDNLRAFGWFGRFPHVSKRVAAETAAVLRFIAAGGR